MTHNQRYESMLPSRNLSRKIDPGEGYRLLEYGEKLNPDDEELLYRVSWVKVLFSECEVGSRMAQNVYRRKVD